MDPEGDEEDGDEAEVDDGVNEDGGSACLEVGELHEPAPPRDLKQKPRSQHHKQQHRYHHRPPIRHLSFSL